ncbi:hypothetical protein NRB56_66000 [Nocardia sp. RB56]|uniref:Uncharacterized protein n=2 Tax=Nocardia aurantia TaxID=2585199 RepID=A0A7K0E1H2_9NOCA|nr:hypothetical protein [Nocardia aurantia]
MRPNTILEFILGLLRDHEAAAGYCADPAAALCAAGLAAVTPEDIAAVAPMVAESALITDGFRLTTIVAVDAVAVPAGTRHGMPTGGFAVLDSELTASLRDSLIGRVGAGTARDSGGAGFAGTGRAVGTFAATGGPESIFGVEVITDLGVRAEDGSAGIGRGNRSAPNGSESSGFGWSTDGSASTGAHTDVLDGNGSGQLPGVFPSDPGGFEPSADLSCPPGHAKPAHPGGRTTDSGTGRSGDRLAGPDVAGAPSLSDEGGLGGDADGTAAVARIGAGWGSAEVLSLSDEGGLGGGAPKFAGASANASIGAAAASGSGGAGLHGGSATRAAGSLTVSRAAVAGTWSSVDVAHAFGSGVGGDRLGPV